MAANVTPRHQAKLLAEAGSIAGGLAAHAAGLGFHPRMETELRDTMSSTVETESNFGKVKYQRRASAKAAQGADKAAGEFLMAARAVLVRFLGNRWSAAWEPTGFPDQSTMVPRTQSKREQLCASLARYLADQPAHAIPQMGVTPAEAEAQHAALRAARKELLQQKAAQGERRKSRNAAKRQLRKDVRYVKVMLKMKLAPDDSRWHSFGLNRPADGNVPERVASVSLAQGRPGEMGVSWKRAKLATRYRVFAMVVGVDEEFQARATVKDPKATLDGFIAGQRVRVRVVAANKSGEARPSAKAEMVVR